MRSNQQPTQRAIILSHPTAPRVMAFLPEPTPCPACNRMAMIVIVTAESTTCVQCAPEVV